MWPSEMNILFLPSATPKEMSPAFSERVPGTRWEFPCISGRVSASMVPSHSHCDTSTQWLCPRRGEHVFIPVYPQHSKYAAQAGIGLWGPSYE